MRMMKTYLEYTVPVSCIHCILWVSCIEYHNGLPVVSHSRYLAVARHVMRQLSSETDVLSIASNAIDLLTDKDRSIAWINVHHHSTGWYITSALIQTHFCLDWSAIARHLIDDPDTTLDWSDILRTVLERIQRNVDGLNVSECSSTSFVSKITEFIIFVRLISSGVARTSGYIETKYTGWLFWISLLMSSCWVRSYYQTIAPRQIIQKVKWNRSLRLKLSLSSSWAATITYSFDWAISFSLS